jgi:hypothetical protein
MLSSGKANQTRLKTASDFGTRLLGEHGFSTSQVRNALFAPCAKWFAATIRRPGRAGSAARREITGLSGRTLLLFSAILLLWESRYRTGEMIRKRHDSSPGRWRMIAFERVEKTGETLHDV